MPRFPIEYVKRAARTRAWWEKLLGKLRKGWGKVDSDAEAAEFSGRTDGGWPRARGSGWGEGIAQLRVKLRVLNGLGMTEDLSAFLSLLSGAGPTDKYNTRTGPSFHPPLSDGDMGEVLGMVEQLYECRKNFPQTLLDLYGKFTEVTARPHGVKPGEPVARVHDRSAERAHALKKRKMYELLEVLWKKGKKVGKIPSGRVDGTSFKEQADEIEQRPASEGGFPPLPKIPYSK